MTKIKTQIVQFEHWILIAYLGLCFIGLYMNLNISSVNDRTMMTFFKQSAWFVIAFTFMLGCFKFIRLDKIKSFIPLLTLLNLILLALVLVFGVEIKGSMRSYRFMGVNFQPSLTMRVMLVLYFAWFLDKKKDLIPQSHLKTFLWQYKPIIIAGMIAFAIILRQRHFSVIIISAVTLFSMLWIARIRLDSLIAIMGISLILGYGVISFGASYRGSRMEIYHKYSLFHQLVNRSTPVIESDDYQVRESLISLSQGGWFGTTSDFGQAKHNYLPESTTDYIFSVIGEEYGFFGSMIVFALYLVIFFKGMLASWNIKDFFLRLAGIGLTLNIFFNAMVNIGVAISALPSTGVTLPFISYGGTSMVTNSICIGLLLSITAVRKPREVQF